MADPSPEILLPDRVIELVAAVLLGSVNDDALEQAGDDSPEAADGPRD